jgi:hypothetical protein
MSAARKSKKAKKVVDLFSAEKMLARWEAEEAEVERNRGLIGRAAYKVLDILLAPISWIDDWSAR